MAFAEFVQERTQGGPRVLYYFWNANCSEEGTFFYTWKLRLFFLSPSSEGSNTVFVFCLG